MADTTPPLVHDPRLNEMAKLYFKGRILAIRSSLFDVEQARRESRLTLEEFIAIRRSLIGAQREVQVALDSISRAEP